MVIAIDGTGCSGKSTVAKKLAKRIGFLYLNTGAIYRAVAFVCNQNGVESGDIKGIEALLKTIKYEQLVGQNGEMVVEVNGKDVTAELYSPLIGNLSAVYSPIPIVREFVKSIQHQIADKTNSVVEGRDVGTVVFPQAEVKFFVTASTEIRARRRMKDFAEQGKQISFEQVLRDIEERDERDMTRKISPLKQAEDAILLMNDFDSPEPAVDIMEKAVKEKIKI